MPTILCLFICFALQLSGSDKEQVLGKSLRDDLRRQARPLPAGVDGEVKELGNLLAPEMYFEVMDVDREQILGYPGGFVVVPLKVLKRLRSRPELALALAHAVGHIVLRHGVKQARPGGGPMIYMEPHMMRSRPTAVSDELEADKFAAELVKSRL
jgi:Zn-dependent protease with chaperone function